MFHGGNHEGLPVCALGSCVRGRGHSGHCRRGLLRLGDTAPDSGGNSLTINGNVPIAYAKRSTSLNVNPTNGAPFAKGGDLMIRELSSPSAREFNVTAAITQGNGDVSDPEVSYDGKKIVFAMRCPTSNTSSVGGVAACTGHWNIWEYDMSPGLSSGIFRRITSSTTDDDVDPAYLPADRGFVFSSNRQTTTKSQALGQSYFQVDEYERERVFNLHTVDRNGGAVTQISVNQSHDRNPVVRPNGDIMFSRWEHVGPRNRFAIFRVKPDGTDMFVLYGAHSGGNSFLHPRDMDPRGAYAGKVVSSLMPLSGTQEGGALMLIDAANFSEQNTPANAQVIVGKGGQVQWTEKEIDLGRGLSEFGRITAPFPLWDGTDRVLLAYRPCEVTRNGVVVPCATLTAAERAMLADDTMSRAQQALLPVQDNAPAVYSIYMVDPAKQTFLIVAAPPSGFMYTDPVAIQPRPEPNATQPTVVDETLEGAEPRADRGAQRVRHRRPRPHGRIGAGAGRPAVRLQRRYRQDGAGRCGRHPLAGTRHRQDQGPGGSRLSLRTGVFRSCDSRGRAAGQCDGHARGDRRD